MLFLLENSFLCEHLFYFDVFGVLLGARRTFFSFLFIGLGFCGGWFVICALVASFFSLSAFYVVWSWRFVFVRLGFGLRRFWAS